MTGAAPTTFRCLTLRGEVLAGIEAAGQMVEFAPHWGMTRHGRDAMAATVGSGTIHAAHVWMVDGFPVLVPTAGSTATAELVLVQAYSPGCGARRRPDFRPEMDGATVLTEAATSGGSGNEQWSLVVAPLGWAAGRVLSSAPPPPEPTPGDE